MNDLIKPDFKPIQAIMVYQQDLDDNGDNYYLETRRIHKGRMMEGVPMTKNMLGKIMSEINTEDVDKIHCDGFLPSNLLYQGRNNLDVELIWYMKAGFRTLLFSKNLGIKDGVIRTPTLVFKLVGDSLSVFAVKTTKPKENTILYKVPFHNIYEDGRVCMGSAKVLKSNEINEIMKNHESAFFQSKFTSSLSQVSIKGNLNTTLSRCIELKAAVPNNLLIRHKNMKLIDLL